MKRSLLLTNDFLPVISGISTVFYHIWKYFPGDRMFVLTPDVKGAFEFDRTAAFKPVRFRPNRESLFGKAGSMCSMFLWTAYYVLFRNVREIHAGQVLTSGPIGYFFQKIFRIPCFLWVYSGESTSAYSTSRLYKWVAAQMIRRCRCLVTNSPATTAEFINFGVSRDRIIEIIPAVDSEYFLPGPKPVEYVRKYNLEDKAVVVTVARLVKRKGHDLVLKAMNLLKARENLHYVIVGAGNDRERLESLVTEYGLKDKVTFAGKVEDHELPDYYRLGDVFVMPNREVFEETGSLEGFGISFIEAGACGRPVIAGRSGGAVNAVEDGVTGCLIDSENPQECADTITYLLDHPEIRTEMGRKGRERVVKYYSWKQRAETLAKYLTVASVTVIEPENNTQKDKGFPV